MKLGSICIHRIESSVFRARSNRSNRKELSCVHRRHDFFFNVTRFFSRFFLSAHRIVRREGSASSSVFPPRIPNERLHASTEQPASGGWVQVGAARSPRTGSRFRRWTPRQDPRGVGAPADPATPAERHHLQSDGDLPDGDRGTGPNIFQKHTNGGGMTRRIRSSAVSNSRSFSPLRLASAIFLHRFFSFRVVRVDEAFFSRVQIFAKMIFEWKIRGGGGGERKEALQLERRFYRF